MRNTHSRSSKQRHIVSDHLQFQEEHSCFDKADTVIEGSEAFYEKKSVCSGQQVIMISGKTERGILAENTHNVSFWKGDFDEVSILNGKFRIGVQEQAEQIPVAMFVLVCFHLSDSRS